MRNPSSVGGNVSFRLSRITADLSGSDTWWIRTYLIKILVCMNSIFNDDRSRVTANWLPSKPKITLANLAKVDKFLLAK